MNDRRPLERLHRFIVDLQAPGTDEGQAHALFREWVGRAPDDATARRRARKAVADAAAIAVRSWTMWIRERGGTMMGTLTAALRQTMREIRVRPLQAAVVVGTLAIAVGANAALFTAAETLLVRTLPYADADRIVKARGYGVTGFRADGSFEVKDEFAAAPGVAATAFYTPDGSATLTGSRNRRVRLAHVASNFFDVMGVDLALGGGLEGLDDGVRAAVIGHGLWRSDFGGDPGVVGGDVMLNGKAYRVVGVAPPEVRFPADADLWISYPAEFEFLGGSYGAEAVGRLEPGVDPLHVAAEMAEVTAEERGEFVEMGYPVPPGTRLVPLRDELVGSVRGPILVLFGAAGLVLLLGVLNLTSVWINRVLERGDEFRTRRALGASRGRLVGQLVAEVTVLSALGGGAALAVAAGGTRLLATRLPAGIPGVGALGISPSTVAFAGLISLTLGIVVGLLAGLRGGTAGLAGSRTGRTRGRAFVERGLVVGQGALALVLVVGALLTARSLQRLAAVPLGFDPDGTLTLTVRVPEAEADGSDAILAYAHAVQARLSSVGGVEAVGWTSRLPLSTGIGTGARFRAVGAAEGDVTSSSLSAASPAFFEAAGIALVAGRGVDPDMGADEIVVNRALADSVFGGAAQAVGATLEEYVREGENFVWTPRRVRGVVGSVRPAGPRNEAGPAHYLPPERWPTRELGFALRVPGNPSEWRGAAEAAVLDVNPRIVPYDVRTLREATDRLVETDRTLAQVISGFSAAGLLLAALGLYGVIGRYVASRRRELGIRLAVGARPGTLVAGLVRSGAALGALAVAVGIPVSLLAAPALESRLFQVPAYDPWTVGVAAVLVVVVTVVAAWIPARRVLRVSPRDALTAE